MPEIRVEGRRLRYEDTGGEGPAVLLLHGFPLSSAMWEPQLEALGDRFRLIAPDQPGFGGSNSPADPEAWRIGDYGDTACALLDALGIDRAVVVGHSMGGYVAFSMLRRHADRIRALVLLDTRPGADSRETFAAREEQQEEVRTQGIAALKPRLLQKLLAPKTLGDTALERSVLSLMDHPVAGYVAALEAMKRRPDSTPELSHIRVPTLVVVGAEDVLTPPSVARAMQAAIPGALLAEVPGAGHLANLEEPGGFNEALASFLAAL
ncbi:MAG TPA: alpha/beta fold hydrolase [Vulgatibacter sp.]|nr:alpha/beta fold hydrolase [Vulgatibacter sp.]